jgi:uncharacterized protein YwgA
MPMEVPQRLWLPLLILNETGPLVSKTKFQKLAFLSQYLSKIDVYDFKKDNYGPYSKTFDLDTMCFANLINHNISQSRSNPERHYYTFEITQEGKNQLQLLQKQINPKQIELVKSNIDNYKDKSLCELLEEVYTEFAIEQKDSENLLRDVKYELERVQAPITHCFLTYHNRQSTFVLSVLEIIKEAVESLEKITDTVRRGVVLNISNELIQYCKDLSNEIVPPTDSKLLRSKFLELSELESFLREYCDTRQIMKDPLTRPIEEMFTEKEAELLSQSLKEVKMPA